MELKWHCLHYDELSKKQLYELLCLRQMVFVVEQDCAYLDMDYKDQTSYHLLGINPNERLLAYARLLPKGLYYQDATAIGRIITHPEHRGSGLGLQLMEESIKENERLWGKGPIRLSAQSHLNDFYEKFGFLDTGKHYLEDGIPHQEMLRKE